MAKTYEQMAKTYEQMAKTYEQKMKVYKATCINMAQMEVVYAKFEINSERADAAGVHAKNAARWIFTAYPELREEIA